MYIHVCAYVWGWHRGKEGDGPTGILFHPFMQSSSSWDPPCQSRHRFPPSSSSSTALSLLLQGRCCFLLASSSSSRCAILDTCGVCAEEEGRKCDESGRERVSRRNTFTHQPPTWWVLGGVLWWWWRWVKWSSPGVRTHPVMMSTWLIWQPLDNTFPHPLKHLWPFLDTFLRDPSSSSSSCGALVWNHEHMHDFPTTMSTFSSTYWLVSSCRASGGRGRKQRRLIIREWAEVAKEKAVSAAECLAGAEESGSRGCRTTGVMLSLPCAKELERERESGGESPLSPDEDGGGSWWGRTGLVEDSQSSCLWV